MAADSFTIPGGQRWGNQSHRDPPKRLHPRTRLIERFAAESRTADRRRNRPHVLLIPRSVARVHDGHARDSNRRLSGTGATGLNLTWSRALVWRAADLLASVSLYVAGRDNPQVPSRRQPRGVWGKETRSAVPLGCGGGRGAVSSDCVSC